MAATSCWNRHSAHIRKAATSDARRAARACLEAMGIELWREKVPTDTPANRNQGRAEVIGHSLPGNCTLDSSR